LLENNTNNAIRIKSKKRITNPERKYLKEITVAGVRDQLLTTNIIDEFISVIGSGKEATVLLARETGTSDLVCVKVFRLFTGTIRRQLRGTKHLMEDDMASIAAKQEYWNLMEMYQANIPVPRPRKLIKNLDDIPFPARDLLDMEIYLNHPLNDIGTMRSPATDVITSRGCRRTERIFKTLLLILMVI